MTRAGVMDTDQLNRKENPLMRAPKPIYVKMLLATLATAIVVGCGQLPTNPIAVAPQSFVPIEQTAPSSLLGVVGSILDPLVKLIWNTLQLVGNVGGSLSNGRWRVEIPSGAVAGNGTVSLGVQSSTAASCKLEISPSSLNHFSKPVKLTIDCGSVPSDQLKSYVIYWYNPTTGTWTEVAGSTVDLQHKTVSAPLYHFSTYAAGPRGGKGGW